MKMFTFWFCTRPLSLEFLKFLIFRVALYIDVLIFIIKYNTVKPNLKGSAVLLWFRDSVGLKRFRFVLYYSFIFFLFQILMKTKDLVQAVSI